MMDKKVWLVTGSSKGLGLELTKTLLSNGQTVISTSRNKKELISKLGEESDTFLPVTLDILSETDIHEKIALAKEKFGRIDVLVNNAGYSHLGTIEDSSDEDVRNCFDVNFFGTLNMIRAISPIMREQKSGHIFNTSSVAGVTSDAFGAIYSATKFAVNAISQGVAQELDPFGIKVTNVIPGYFRTEFLSANSYVASKNSEPYEQMAEYIGQFLEERNGNQAGDPHKASLLYLKVANMENPPLDLPMGTDAFETVIDVFKNKISHTEEIKQLIVSTDFE